MNSLTKQLTSELRPRAALVAYSGEDELRNHYFLELRPIDSQGRMCAARPITVDFMNELANSYSEARNGTPHGLIPANLLFADSRQSVISKNVFFGRERELRNNYNDSVPPSKTRVAEYE